VRWQRRPPKGNLLACQKLYRGSQQMSGSSIDEVFQGSDAET